MYICHHNKRSGYQNSGSSLKKIISINVKYSSRFQKLYYICIRKLNGLVVQLVRMPPCHGGGREFESRPDRIKNVVLSVFIAEVYVVKPMRSFSHVVSIEM